MARVIALIEFEDAHVMYAAYCNTADTLFGRELFDTEEMAKAALTARESSQSQVRHHYEPLGATDSEEPVVIKPNWHDASSSFEIPSRASRKHRWLTGPASLDDEAREYRAERNAGLDTLFAGEDTFLPAARPPRDFLIGDRVEVVDRNGKVLSAQTVTKLHRQTVKTDCGRRWTKAEGRWYDGERVRVAPVIRLRKVY
jgi:hypothetical protein